MFSIVTFKHEKGYPVEGVPSSWIKIKGVKTFCFWPKKDPTVGIGSLIRRCVSPEASWTLVECRVITKAKNYEDMVKQRKLAEEMTANESSGLEGDDNSEPSDSDDDKIPSPPRKKRKQPTTKSPIRHVIESEDNVEAMNHSFSSDKNSPAEFSSVEGGELATIKRTLSELVLKVDKLIETNSKENKLIHTEIVDTKEEVRVLKKVIKKNNNEPSAEPSNLPSLPVRNADELKNLEEILKDQNEMQNLVKKLSNYGGSQLRSTISLF